MKIKIKRAQEKYFAILLAITILSFIAAPAVDEGRATYTEFMDAASFIEPGIRYSDAPNISILAEGQKIFLPDQQIKGGIVCYTMPEGFGVHNPVRIHTDSFVALTEGSDPQLTVAGLRPSLHFKYSPNAQLLPIDKNSSNGNKIAVNKVNCDADITYRSGLGTEISNITITPAQQDVLIVIKSPGGEVVNFFQYISVRPKTTVAPEPVIYPRNPIILTSGPIIKDFYEDRIARVLDFRNAYINKIYGPNYKSGGKNAQLENKNGEYDDYELAANEMKTFLEAPGTNMPDKSRNLAIQILDLINNEGITAYQRIDNRNNQNRDDKTGFGLMMLRIIDILKDHVLTKNNSINLYNPNARFLGPVTPSPSIRPSSSSSVPRTSPSFRPSASPSISRTTSPAKPSSSSTKPLTSPSAKPSVRPSYVDGRVMYTDLMAAADFISRGILYHDAPNVSILKEGDKILLPDQDGKGGIVCYTIPEGFGVHNPVRVITDSVVESSKDGDQALSISRREPSLHNQYTNYVQILPTLDNSVSQIKVKKVDCVATLSYDSKLGTEIYDIRITQPKQDVLVVVKSSRGDVINFFQYISVKPSSTVTPRLDEFARNPIVLTSDLAQKDFYHDRIARNLEFQRAYFEKIFNSVRSDRNNNLSEKDRVDYELVATKLKTFLETPGTNMSDRSRNLALQILDLINNDAMKALLRIDNRENKNSKLITAFGTVMDRIVGILQQQLFIKNNPRLLFNPSASFLKPIPSPSIKASSSSTRPQTFPSIKASTSLIPRPSPLTPTETRERNIRRNIFFRGLDKNNSRYDQVVVNLEGEVLYKKTCSINNSVGEKWVTKKTESHECNPQDISDINIDYYDSFSFDEALKRHNVNPESPLAFELFKRLIGAMRNYYAFTSQKNLYYGEKYSPNLKQERNYYKLISNRNDNVFTTDYGVYAEIEGQRENIVNFKTNQYYLFSVLTDSDFNKLFIPLSESSIVASYYADRNDSGSIVEGHIILGRGLKSIRPAYFHNSRRFDSARINFNDFPNDPDLPKLGYYYTNYPAYQRNIEDFGLRVGAYVNVNGVRERVSNIKFFSGALEVGQYVPYFPLFYYSTYAMGKNSSNFCTVDVREPVDSFSSIVIPGVNEVLKSGNRIGFICPNLPDGTNIKVIFNYPLNARDKHNFKRDPHYYGYFKVNKLPVVLARDSGKAYGSFVSFDLIKAEGYSQADSQRGEVLIRGYPCRFVTEAVVHSRLRQSSQAIDSRFGNQINTSGYCQFRGDDLLKMRITEPAGANGPTWEGKAVSEDFKRNFIVDKTAPLKKNFATNLGKISKGGYYGNEYHFPFGPDYWLKTNLGDFVFKGDFIYLYDSAKDKYDPIYIAKWQYNDIGKYDSYGDSDAYDVLNPILAERGSNFFEAHTATIRSYLGPTVPRSFPILRQAVIFYAAGANNIKSISVNVSGINYACGDITLGQDSQVRCNFGGLNVDRTCSAAQVSGDLKRSDKFLDGKAPMMNSCSVSITTKDSKVIKLPLVEDQSIHRDRVYRQSYNDTRNVYEETLADRIYYVGTRPPEYLRLSGGYTAFANSSVTVNGKPCIRPENIALGKIDEVGCYFKSDGLSNEVVATIRIDGHNIRTQVVTIEKIDLTTIEDKTLRDIGINSFQVSYDRLKYPIQGIKSIKAGTRNCDFPLLTFPATGKFPRMTIAYDAVCYFDIPAKKSYVPTNNATVLTHEGQSLSFPFTEKGLTPKYSSDANASKMSYTVFIRHDYQETPGKYSKPLIFAQNPLIANTCEQACLSEGLIFDGANYNQAFCSNYASSNVNASFGLASNASGGGCQSYYTSNFFKVTQYVNWSNYSSTMPYKLSTRDSDGRVCRCVRY